MIPRICLPFILSLLLLACATNNNIEVVRSYIDTHNSHDIDKSLVYYHDDAVFELKGVWIKEGKAEMRGLEEFDAEMNSHLAVGDIRQSADTIYCRIVENNDWFTALGITNLVHDPVVFVIRDQKIKHIIGYPDEESGKEIEAAFGRVFEWSQKTGDSTVYELLPQGEFVYSTEAGRKWKALFERMQEYDNIP